jgi:hypothetical protein
LQGNKTGNRHPKMKKLLTDKQLVAELDCGLTTRSIASLRRAKKIPVVKIGYRTLRYDLERVVSALQRREIREIKVTGNGQT